MIHLLFISINQIKFDELNFVDLLIYFIPHKGYIFSDSDELGFGLSQIPVEKKLN